MAAPSAKQPPTTLQVGAQATPSARSSPTPGRVASRKCPTFEHPLQQLRHSKVVVEGLRNEKDRGATAKQLGTTTSRGVQGKPFKAPAL